ncbi:MAG: HAD family hydrolase [Deltaproteobacteria bacterium]|nr:HAD family hydrolase [Deltaproteobacteria bacterium]
MNSETPKKIEAVVFDLDGTLLDTLEDLAASMNRVLESKKFPSHPVESYLHFIGDGARMLAQRVLPEQERSESQINNIHQAFEKDYRDNWGFHTGLYQGIAEMLDQLTERGLKLSILSNKPHEFTLITSGYFLSKWNFECVFGQRQGVPKKPDPAGVYEISEQLKIPVEQMVYLGDSGVDMLTAKAAGCYAVGVTWGFREPEELLDSGAECLISEPQELGSLINPPKS